MHSSYAVSLTAELLIGGCPFSANVTPLIESQCHHSLLELRESGTGIVHEPSCTSGYVLPVDFSVSTMTTSCRKSESCTLQYIGASAFAAKSSKYFPFAINWPQVHPDPLGSVIRMEDMQKFRKNTNCVPTLVFEHIFVQQN